jgi:hypothetical protein
VESMRDTPAAAMSEWVMDMKPRNITPVIGRDRTLPQLSTVTRISVVGLRLSGAFCWVTSNGGRCATE